MHAKTILTTVFVLALASIPSCPAPAAAGRLLVDIGKEIGKEIIQNVVEDQVQKHTKRGPVPRYFARGAAHNVTVTGAGHADANGTFHYPGVPDYNIKMCKDNQAAQKDKKVHVNQTNENTIRIENVVPACMNLAAVFTEHSPPVPCGSACLNYPNMTAPDKQNMVNVLHTLLGDKNETTH